MVVAVVLVLVMLLPLLLLQLAVGVVVVTTVAPSSRRRRRWWQWWRWRCSHGGDTRIKLKSLRRVRESARSTEHGGVRSFGIWRARAASNRPSGRSCGCSLTAPLPH